MSDVLKKYVILSDVRQSELKQTEHKVCCRLNMSGINWEILILQIYQTLSVYKRWNGF